MEGWPQTFTINEDKIRRFIAEYQPNFVHVFSFAIHSQWDLKCFNTYTRPQIERALGVTLSHVPTTDDDIIAGCCAVTHMAPQYVNFEEMCNFWGKQIAFRLYVIHRHVNKLSPSPTPVDVVLLDDAVYNETFSMPDSKVTGRILNIDAMR